MTHTLGAECPGLPDAGGGQEPSGGCLQGRAGGKVLCQATKEGREGKPGREEGQKAVRGLRQTRPHLQLCLQARSFAQERGHHVVCDGELVWNPHAAADQAWVQAIEVLVPKEAVLCPVLGHVFWWDGVGASHPDRVRDREPRGQGPGQRKTTDTGEEI